MIKNSYLDDIRAFVIKSGGTVLDCSTPNGMYFKVTYGAASCHLRSQSAALSSLYIYNLESWPHQLGHGSFLLTRLCKAADLSNVSLYLHPQPFGEDKMPKAKLVAWYRRFGFEAIRQKGILMREPQPATSRQEMSWVVRSIGVGLRLAMQEKGSPSIP